MKDKLLEIFDAAGKRVEETIAPINGWFEKLSDSFCYRFRVEAKDVTSYQKYYDGDHYVGCIYDFTESEKDQMRTLVDFEFTNANAFYIAPRTMIYPHIDYSPKRSQKTTIANLSGEGSILRLYDTQGNIVFEMPQMIDKYTLYPCKIIHSLEVKDTEAKLINFWHD